MDSSQSISMDEIVQVLHENNRSIGLKVLETVVAISDTNKDGKIQKNEF